MHTGANRSYVSEYTLFEKRAANFPLGVVGGSPTSTPKRIVQLPRGGQSGGANDSADDAASQGAAAQKPATETTERRVPSLRNVNSPLRLPDLPRLRSEGAEDEAGRKWSIGTLDSSSGSPRGDHAKNSPLAATHEVGSLEWPSLDDDAEEEGSRLNDAASDAAERHRAASAPLPGGVFFATTSGSSLDGGGGGGSGNSSAAVPASDSGGEWVAQHLTLSSGKEVDFLQTNAPANAQGGRSGRGRRSSVLAPPTSLALPGPHEGGSTGSGVGVPQGGSTGSQGRVSGYTMAGAKDSGGGAEGALRNRINQVQTEFQKWDTLRQDLELEIASVRKGTRISTLQERDDLKNLYQQATECVLSLLLSMWMPTLPAVAFLFCGRFDGRSGLAFTRHDDCEHLCLSLCYHLSDTNTHFEQKVLREPPS